MNKGAWLLVALLLLIAIPAGTQTIKYLNGLSGASGVSGTDALAVCQVSTGCGAGTPLVRQTFSAILTWINANLPTPSASTLGAVQSKNCGAGSHVNSINTDGTETCTADSGSTPVVFVGTTVGTANAQSMSSPTPSGFAFTDGYKIHLKVGAGLTNTSATTLNVNSTGALAVATQDSGGNLAALIGGELAAGNELDLNAQASCPAPISANCYVITTTPGNQKPITASATITAAQWMTGQPIACTANCTITLPAANTLSIKGGLLIQNTGAVVTTLTPASSDGINNLAVNTSATISCNVSTMVTTSGNIGAGAFTVPRNGLVQGLNVTITCGADGTTTIAASGSSSAPATPQGRLTLSTGKPVMQADVTAATSLFYDTSNAGNQAPVWNGSSMVALTITSDEISMGFNATNHPASSFFSVFGVNNSGALALCTVQWTNGTTPGAAATSLKNGVWTITAAPTHCFGGAAGTTDLASAIGGANQATELGCMATTGTAAQTAMQFTPAPASGGPTNGAWRGITNNYNLVEAGSYALDSKATWTIAGTTYAALDASNNNRVSYFDCHGQLPVSSTIEVINQPANGGFDLYGSCLNSTTCTPNAIAGGLGNGTINMTATMTESFRPILGFNFVQAVEKFVTSAGVSEGNAGVDVRLNY